MVAPLRSQVRLRLSLAHWAYFALLRAQRARFVRPLGIKGSLLVSGTTVGSSTTQKPPFGTKGRWHGAAVTEGLETQKLQEYAI